MQLYIASLLTNRDQLPIWLAQQGLKVVCEVGVRKGDNLLNMLKSGPTRLVGVDTWKKEDSDIDIAQTQLDEFLSNLRRYEEMHKNLQIIQGSSVEVAATFDDETFDFVYIDALHTYEAVRADIDAWWPKVKKGRYLGGHDYEMPKNEQNWGVVQAVHEFIGRNDLNDSFFTTFPKEPSSSWFIRKPS